MFNINIFVSSLKVPLTFPVEAEGLAGTSAEPDKVAVSSVSAIISSSSLQPIINVIKNSAKSVIFFIV